MEIGSHFDAIVECCEFLEYCRKNDDMEKGDVIDSMNMRLQILLRRSVCSATFPYMSMSDWQVVTDIPSDDE
jgi:hypothetical protein